MSGQDDSNPALWLPTWAGQMELHAVPPPPSKILQISQKWRPEYQNFLYLFVPVTCKDSLRSLYQWNWKTRKLKAPTRVHTKKTKLLPFFINLFCSKPKYKKHKMIWSHGIGIRELKHDCLCDTDGNQKWAVFTFNLPSHNHIHIAKYLSPLEMSSTKIWETIRS